MILGLARVHGLRAVVVNRAFTLSKHKVLWNPAFATSYPKISNTVCGSHLRKEILVFSFMRYSAAWLTFGSDKCNPKYILGPLSMSRSPDSEFV